MKELFKFEYEDEELTVVEDTYMAGGGQQKALDIFCADGQPYCRLTVYLEDERGLPEMFYYIKSWSENKPITDFLRASEHFVDTELRCITGFVTAEVWRLQR